MPFAMSRVGIFNESDEGSAEQQSGLQRRHKGISLEDLKKQTALRLAQEQQQAQILPGKTAARGVDPRTKHPVVTPQTLAARRMAATAPIATQQTIPVHHYQRLHHHHHHHQIPLVHHIPNEPPGIVQGYGASGQIYDQLQQGGKLVNRNVNPRQNKFSEMSLAEHQHQGLNTTYYSDQRSQYLRANSAPLLPANPLSSSAFNSASGNIGGVQTSSTSKLPHGLTVHELKEMTKARLQAEAADKMSLSSGTFSDRPPSSSLADMENREASANSGAFDASQSSYGHAISLHGGLDGRNDSRMMLIQVHTMSFEQPSNLRQPAQVSPIPTPMQVFGGHSAFSSSFNDAAAKDSSRNYVGSRNRVDSFPDSNWENASVTSHNSTVASEYLGSESAFSSGINGFTQMDVPSGISYPLGINGRSTAFSVDMTSREATPTSTSSPITSSYFEPSASTIGQNRQRAMTLSPRPGLSLLHEDRPGFSEDELGIPSFTRGHSRQQLNSRSRRSFSPILQPQAFPSDGLGGGFGSGSLPGLIGGNVMENRPRTSSLPTDSLPANDFAMDSGRPRSRRSTDSFNIRGAPIQEYFVNRDSCSDVLQGPSSLYSGLERRSYHTSSVFRNDHGRIPVPPGLGHDNVGSIPLVSRAGSLDNFGSNRTRASTWTPTPHSDFFESNRGPYDRHSDDVLAGDLASILKLSGAEEKPDMDRPPGIFPDGSGSFLGRNSNDF